MVSHGGTLEAELGRDEVWWVLVGLGEAAVGRRTLWWGFMGCG